MKLVQITMVVIDMKKTIKYEIGNDISVGDLHPRSEHGDTTMCIFCFEWIELKMKRIEEARTENQNQVLMK